VSERFEADFSRQYRIGVNAAPLLGFAVAAVASYLAGFDLVTGGIWTLAVTLALLSQRWTMLGVSYELGHTRLTITRGPYRRHIRWNEIQGMRHTYHRRFGVGGFALERRGGGDVAIAPRYRARFTRALALHAPHVRFAWEHGDGDGCAVAPASADEVA